MSNFVEGSFISISLVGSGFDPHIPDCLLRPPPIKLFDLIYILAQRSIPNVGLTTNHVYNGGKIKRTCSLPKNKSTILGQSNPQNSGKHIFWGTSKIITWYSALEH